MTQMNWPVVQAEAVLLTLACAIALIDLFVTDPRRRLTFWLTQATIAVVGALHWCDFDAGLTLYGMQAMVVSDPMGHLLAFFACVRCLSPLPMPSLTLPARHAQGRVLQLSLFVLLGIR
jgi:NADH-quinone oxidoreductase subunit N